MQRRSLLAALTLLTMTLAACLGAPLDEARPGDRVTVALQTVDTASGFPVLDEERTFVLGADDPRWPAEALALVDGARVGAARTVQVPADPAVEFPQRVEVDLFHDTLPRATVFSAAQMQQQLGITDPRPGELHVLWMYTVRVVEVEGDDVHAEILLRDGDTQRDPIIDLGGFVVSRLEGDSIHRGLEPVEGLVFARTAPAGSLSVGAYKVLEHNATTLVLGRNADPQAYLSGMDLEHRVTVLGLDWSHRDPVVRGGGGLERDGGAPMGPLEPVPAHAH